MTDKPDELCNFGCNHELIDEHTCPYREEIDEDHTTLCRCCKQCEEECADDI